MHVLTSLYGMLRIELPVTYAPMKLSPRLAGPNADGAVFYGFIYSTLRSEIVLEAAESS